MAKPAPITDSPWLWAALFTGAGLAMLLATGGKFGNRQSQIERKGQAQAAAASDLKIEEDAAGRKTATNVPEYSTPNQTEIRLAPLATALAVLCGISLVMLIRERFSMSATEDTELSEEFDE